MRLGDRVEIHGWFHPAVAISAYCSGNDRKFSIVIYGHAIDSGRHGVCSLDWCRGLFGESRSVLRIASILLIVAGIAGLKLFAGEPSI